jgi:hypothetical protein
MLMRLAVSAFGAATLCTLLSQSVIAQPFPPHPDTPRRTLVIPVPCVGDCNGDGRVTVDEILTAINIALGNTPVSACPGLESGCEPGVVCIMEAVDNALNDCLPVQFRELRSYE